MKKIKLSREYGGWVTLTLTFVLFLFYSYINKDYKGLIFWVPAFLGISIFDRNFFEINKITLFFLSIIILFSLISIFLYFFVLIPYTLFLISYFLRQRRISTYLVTLFGLSGEILLLFFSLKFLGLETLIPFFILIYLYGAQFGVSSFIKGNFTLSLYNILPAFLIIFGYPIFLVSLIRLFYFKIKKIKTIGLIESFSYLAVIVYFILKILLSPQV